MRNSIQYKLVFLLVVVLCSLSYGQKYAIPGAQQQPEWVFPLWFEEGTGQRDTIYLGYSPDASFGFYGPDTSFGEKKQKVDTNKFNVTICSYWYCSTSSALCDSADKVSVSDLTTAGCGARNSTFNILNAMLPLKISWDISLFRDSILPFPTIGTQPELEGVLFHNSDSWNADSNSICGPLNAIVLSDTTDFDGSVTDNYCFRRDSVILINAFNPNSLAPGSIQLKLRPWMGKIHIHGEEELDGTNKIKIFPNPSTGVFTLKSLSNSMNRISIVNLLGETILELPEVNQSSVSLNLQEIGKGLFFVCVYNSSKKVTFTKKIIIE